MKRLLLAPLLLGFIPSVNAQSYAQRQWKIVTDLNGDGDFDDNNEDRLALNSQVRFQNDLLNDNLSVKHSGDYDGDGFQEVYWKTIDSDVYLRALMHADGNIQYANYQNEEQMIDYLTGNGNDGVIGDII